MTVRFPRSIEAMVAITVARFGRRDRTVNNAGSAGPAFTAVDDIGEEDWCATINTNPNAVFMSMKFEIPALLASGGGAGGGSASPRPAPPPSPPPDNSNQPLAITSANAFDVALLGITVPESLIQLLLSMVNSTVALVNTQGALSVTQSCPPGDATITLTDRDTDEFLSSGDRVTLRFAGRCFNDALNDEVTGEMAIELASVSIRGDGDIALAGQLIITDPLRITEQGSGAGAAGIRVSGRFEFSVVAGAGSHPELILINHIPGSPLVMTLVDDASRQTSERIRDFSVRRELFQIDAIDTGFRFQFDFTNESQRLNGRIRCITSSTLTGRFGDRPNDGRVSCRGAGVAEVGIVARQASFGATADVLLDASGGGAPVNVAFPNGTFGGWDGLTEGMVFTVAIQDVTARPGAGEPSELVGTTLQAAVNDAAYDEVRDRIYVSNAAGIVVLDARTLAVIDTVTVPGTPSALALCDDGSVLWFAHAGDSFIQALSTADLTLGTPVPLGGSGLGPPGAYDLAVVPGRPGTVVVATRARSIARLVFPRISTASPADR